MYGIILIPGAEALRRYGEVITHIDDAVTCNGVPVIKQFLSYSGDEIPEKFTIWVPRSLKAMILSGQWENPTECFLYVLPVLNRYHPVNMYQQNTSLRYRIYFPVDLQNILVDVGLEGAFDVHNREHLQCALDHVISISQRELASNTVACRRYNCQKSLDQNVNLKGMEKYHEKLRPMFT